MKRDLLRNNRRPCVAQGDRLSIADTAMNRRLSVLVACVLLSGLWVGCTPTIAPFSAHAYEQAVDLKVDALRVISRAEEPFGKHEKRIEALSLRMEKAWEFAKGRPQNEESAAQWTLMQDPDGYLLGGLLQRWESEGALSYPFIQEAGSLIESAFDTIIGLESGKIGSTRGQP